MEKAEAFIGKHPSVAIVAIVVAYILVGSLEAMA